MEQSFNAHRVHGPRLQVHQDRTRNVASTRRFVVVDINPLELKITITGTETKPEIVLAEKDTTRTPEVKERENFG